MYEIEYTPKAIRDLDWFSKREQRVVLDGIEASLRHEPTVETRNRKRLQPNDIAEWELRLGNFRVLYDVEEEVRVVEVQRVGHKSRDRFFFRGREEEI